jgi:hypothetical protein
MTINDLDLYIKLFSLIPFMIFATGGTFIALHYVLYEVIRNLRKL